MFANSKKVTTFAPAIEREILDKEVIEYSIASLFLSCFVQGMPTAQLENGSALKFRPLTRK